MVGRPRPTSESSIDLTRRYLAELGSYPLLTAEDEANLAQAIADGRAARRASPPGSPYRAASAPACRAGSRRPLRPGGGSSSRTSA